VPSLGRISKSLIAGGRHRGITTLCLRAVSAHFSSTEPAARSGAGNPYRSNATRIRAPSVLASAGARGPSMRGPGHRAWDAGRAPLLQPARCAGGGAFFLSAILPTRPLRLCSDLLLRILAKKLRLNAHVDGFEQDARCDVRSRRHQGCRRCLVGADRIHSYGLGRLFRAGNAPLQPAMSLAAACSRRSGSAPSIFGPGGPRLDGTEPQPSAVLLRGRTGRSLYKATGAGAFRRELWPRPRVTARTYARCRRWMPRPSLTRPAAPRPRRASSRAPP